MTNMQKNLSLSDILDQIEARKVILDRKQVSEWLFEYATQYQSYSGENIQFIADRKAMEILIVADKIYWQLDRPYKLELYSSKKIKGLTKKEYRQREKLKRN